MYKPPIVVFVGDTHVGSDMGLAKPGFYLESKDVYWPMSQWQTWLYENWRTSCKDFEKLTDDYSLIMCFGGDSIDGSMHHGSVETFGTTYEQRKMAAELYMEAAQFADEKWMVPGTMAHVGQQGSHDRSIADLIGARISPMYQLEICGRILNWAHHGINLGRDVTRWDATLANAARQIKYQNIEYGYRQPDLVMRHHTHRTPKKAVKAYGMWIGICPAWQGTGDFVNGFHPDGLPAIGHITWKPISNEEPEVKLYGIEQRITSSAIRPEYTGEPGDTRETLLDEPESLTTTWGTGDQ